VQYTYTLAKNVGSALSLFACAPLDTSKVDYVPNSATGGAVPLSSLCPAAASALANGQQSFSEMAATAGAPVLSVGWFGNVATGESANFGFQVKVTTKTAGTLSQSVRLFDLTPGSTWRTSVAAPNVTIYQLLYLLNIFKNYAP
jgi:hypothetical protein